MKIKKNKSMELIYNFLVELGKDTEINDNFKLEFKKLLLKHRLLRLKNEN